MVASGFLTKLAENNFEEQETNCSFKNGKKQWTQALIITYQGALKSNTMTRSYKYDTS